jgi:hypothetical protein
MTDQPDTGQEAHAVVRHPEGSPGATDLSAMNRYDWFQYYSEKRIVHQWFQVKLLEHLPVRRILEIGPALGVPTALLATAGFEVTTLDFVDRALLGATSHVVANLESVTPVELAGHDCILCCEVLEHFSFETSCKILKTLSESGAPYLIASVPYQALQLSFSCYLNRLTAQKSTSFQFRNAWRRFRKQPPGGHQWEIGYRGYPLSRLKEAATRAGWRITDLRFTAGTRSVFIVATNRERLTR